MPGQPIQLLKIFIASPSDVKLEREKAREEILGLRSLAQKHGFDFEAICWETHATPGMGRGQELINRLVRECDLFVGILWRRFGQPTGEAESGTLEEFHLACQRYAKDKSPEIMLYFREVHPDFLADPGPQLQKVLDFQKQIEEGRVALYFTYRDEEHLATLLRKHLTEWLLRMVPEPATATTDLPTATDAPPLAAFAEHLEFCRTELQKTARPLRLRTLKLPPLFLEEMETEQHSEDGSSESSAFKRPSEGGSSESLAFRRPRNMKVSDAAKIFPHLLILGEPGAGKTTSLKKLAAEYAVWRGEGKEPGLNEPEDFNLPIFVDLSTYPTLAARDPKYGMWRLITASVRGVHDVDVRKRLAAGGCLLLFDGLNEVGESYDEVVYHIRDLVNHEIPRNRFVVTCRPGVYRDELRNEFVAFQLERLTSFNASKVLEIEIGAEKAQAAWKGLDEYTRDLCRNPLMLTLLADELRASDNPPQNRAQLFDRFVDRYLSEWARVKGAGAVRVEKEILSALAWRLGTNRTLLSADEAAAAMSYRLSELQSKKEASSDLNVAELNREFLHHGLLRESAGQTGFFHQAMQEYFFAREIALHEPTDFILQHVSDPAWAEILVFVCGMIEDATEVVKEVMKVDPYWAARCVTYAKKTDAQLVDDLGVLLIQELRHKLDAEVWIGKLYQEMLAVLSIEPRTRTGRIMDIFCQVYSNNAWQAFVHLLVGMNVLERAIPFLEAMVIEQPDNIHLRGLLGWALRVGENFEAAGAQDRRCLELAPESSWSWGGLGLSYRKLKKLEESDFCFRRAIQLRSNSYWLHCQFGFTLRDLKDYEGALAEFNKSIMLNWDYGWSHLGLADTYYDLERFEEAVSEYEISTKVEKRPFRLSSPVAGLARALEAVGRINEARQRYQEYLDRFPWGEHAQEAQEALERLGNV